MPEKPTLRNLSGLEKLFPYHNLPDALPIVGDLAEKGILTILRETYVRRHDPSPIPARRRELYAVNAALGTTQMEREEAGIKVIMIGPSDANERMTNTPVFIYPVYVVFPYFRLFKYLSAHRLSLSNLYHSSDWTISQDALNHVDNLVTAAAEQIPEKPHELYNRLLQEIKMADSLIKEQKDLADAYTHWDKKRRLQDGIHTIHTTKTMDGLNKIKTSRIHEYLITAKKLTEEKPGLNPLYIPSSKTAADSMHTTLEMHMLTDLSLVARLVDPAVQASVDKGRSKVSTNINLQELSRGKARYLNGSSSAVDRSHYDTAKILGL